MRAQFYSELPPAARKIRNLVFVKEQGFKNEFDAVDTDSTHLVIYNHSTAIATCRFYPDAQQSAVLLGRIAELPKYRKNHIGAGMIEYAEKQIATGPYRKIIIHAQEQASGFYKKCGYTPFGTPDFDEGCPHIWMQKTLV